MYSTSCFILYFFSKQENLLHIAIITQERYLLYIVGIVQRDLIGNRLKRSLLINYLVANVFFPHCNRSKEPVQRLHSNSIELTGWVYQILQRTVYIQRTRLYRLMILLYGTRRTVVPHSHQPAQIRRVSCVRSMYSHRKKHDRSDNKNFLKATKTSGMLSKTFVSVYSGY